MIIFKVSLQSSWMKCEITFLMFDMMFLLPDSQWHEAQEGSWEGSGAGQKDWGSPQEEWGAHEEVQGEDRYLQAEKVVLFPK